MGKELSKQTKQNWQINAVLLVSALLASLSGIYFMYFPEGYQGGRNPLYNVTILFTRQTWDLIHTWTGVAMVVIAIVHLVIHWRWIKSMSKKVWREFLAGSSKLSRFGKFNVVINLTIALSGLLTAITGIYFLFDVSRGNVNTTLFLFNRTTWDLIHTWSGVVMILAAIFHFAIHWKWITKVTKRYFFKSEKGNQPVLPNEQFWFNQNQKFNERKLT